MMQTVESRESGARNPAGRWPSVPEGYRAQKMYPSSGARACDGRDSADGAVGLIAHLE